MKVCQNRWHASLNWRLWSKSLQRVAYASLDDRKMKKRNEICKIYPTFWAMFCVRMI